MGHWYSPDEMYGNVYVFMLDKKTLLQQMIVDVSIT